MTEHLVLRRREGVSTALSTAILDAPAVLGARHGVPTSLSTAICSYRGLSTGRESLGVLSL